MCPQRTDAHAHGSVHPTDSTMNPNCRLHCAPTALTHTPTAASTQPIQQRIHIIDLNCAHSSTNAHAHGSRHHTHTLNYLRDLTPRLYNHVFDATIISSPPAVSTYNLRPNSRENQSYSTSSFKLGNDKSLQNSVYSLQHHHSRRPKTIQTIHQTPAAE